MLSTGGSAATLRDAGIAVKDVSEHSGFPEILDGRVKTLVPQIHGGILGRRDLPEHVAQMQAHGIVPIDLVVVNLYPFEATVAKRASFDECVENIDIGGPALIRAAAKNHEFVAVLTETDHYEALLDELTRLGGTTLALRQRLAGAAYARTAAMTPLSPLFSLPAGRDIPSPADAGWHAAPDIALRREPAPIGCLLRYGSAPGRGDGSAGARKGTLVQQPERHGRSVRVRGRVRQPRRGHRETRQPVWCGDRRLAGGMLGPRIALRSGLRIRRHRRAEPDVGRGDG